MLRSGLLVSALVCAAATAPAQMSPSEYATFTSHGKSVSTPVYASGEFAGTVIFLQGSSPEEINFSRQEAGFLAGHGFRVLLPEYLSVTATPEATPANYRRWAEVVDDMVADLRAQPASQKREIALAGIGLGASVALIAAGKRLEVQAMVEWGGQLPNQFFSQVQTWPPLLILHGENDEQVPLVNARQLKRVCQLKDLTCELQIYAGEGHLFSPRIAETANQRMLAFLRTYLH